MFGKTREAIADCSTRIDELSYALRQMRSQGASSSADFDKRLNNIEVWLELLVEERADQTAEQFDKLLGELPKNTKVTNQVLKDLVRQAVKG